MTSPRQKFVFAVDLKNKKEVKTKTTYLTYVIKLTKNVVYVLLVRVMIGTENALVTKSDQQKMKDHFNTHHPSPPDLSVRIEVGEEERVDEGGLAESALPHHHQGELEPLLHGLAMHLKTRKK